MTYDSLIIEFEFMAAERIKTLYRDMVEIRIVEQRLAEMFAAGEIPGFLHLSIGQEAVAAGVGSALTAADTVASTHRGHGHCLTKGIALERFFGELFGKETGACRGRGGSMHVADLSIGMLGANGIVGAGLPIALGSALAHKTLKRDAIAVAFFGDGAQAEGSLHETLNLAVTWGVPLLLACENNGWSEFTPSDKAFSGTLEGLAGVFNIPYRRVDGNDVVAVSEAAANVVDVIRKSGKPAIIEFHTHRVDGHFAGDPQRYRSDDSRKEAQANDPLDICERLFVAAGGKLVALESVRQQIALKVESAINAARRAPDAVPDSPVLHSDEVESACV